VVSGKVWRISPKPAISIKIMLADFFYISAKNMTEFLTNVVKFLKNRQFIPAIQVPRKAYQFTIYMWWTEIGKNL
jgi:hypothetical protein